MLKNLSTTLGDLNDVAGQFDRLAEVAEDERLALEEAMEYPAAADAIAPVAGGDPHAAAHLGARALLAARGKLGECVAGYLRHLQAFEATCKEKADLLRDHAKALAAGLETPADAFDAALPPDDLPAPEGPPDDGLSEADVRRQLEQIDAEDAGPVPQPPCAAPAPAEEVVQTAANPRRDGGAAGEGPQKPSEPPKKPRGQPKPAPANPAKKRAARKLQAGVKKSK